LIKKVVFFCFTPVLKHHIERYGVEVFKSNGFEVELYDFTPLVFPKLHNNLTLSRPANENIILFNEEQKAIKTIQNLGEECFVVITGHYQFENFKFFKALSKTNIPYASNSTSASPGVMGCKEEPFLERVLLKLYRFKLTKLKTLLYKPKLAPLLGIRPPNICILGGENSLNNNGSAALIGKKTELLWAHISDYDNYLENFQKKEKEENFAVFIDVGAPMLTSDGYIPYGATHLTSERYYPSLCRFFDYVEKESKLKVVIAAHPKNNHVDYPEYFGGRRVFRDQSLKVIKKSKLVISHQSTALTYVALEKRPLLFITTSEYEADLSYSKSMKKNAEFFGVRVINIDEEPCSINWEKELSVNEEMYLNYRQKYIKREGSEELNTWQIFANRLKRDL
jgi:hypothetical protein